MARWCLLLMMLFVSLPAAHSQDKGIVWHYVGDWTINGRAVSLSDSIVVNEAKLLKGPGKLTVIVTGGAAGSYYAHRSCPTPSPCPLAVTQYFARTEGAESNRPVGWLEAAINSLTSKRQVEHALSRAVGWNDAVLSLEADGRLELKKALATSRPRVLDIEICPLDGAQPCLLRQQVNWDGNSGRIGPIRGLTNGTYRLRSANGANEAWIRIVPSEDRERIALAYETAVKYLSTWKFAEETEAPKVDRLFRLALAEARVENE